MEKHHKMKFLTTDWYYLSMRSIWDKKFIIEDERAVKFNEDYFREVYEIKEKFYISNIEKAFKIETIDSIKCKKSFYGRFNNLLSIVRTFPKSVLSKVADDRVLALGYVSSNLKNTIIEYALEQKKLSESIMQKAQEKNCLLERKSKNLLNLKRYGSGTVSKIVKKEKNIIIEFIDIPNIIIYSAEIIKQEKKIHQWKDEPFSPITKKIAEEIEIKGDKFIFNLIMGNNDGYENIEVWELSILGEKIICDDKLF